MALAHLDATYHQERQDTLAWFDEAQFTATADGWDTNQPVDLDDGDTVPPGTPPANDQTLTWDNGFFGFWGSKDNPDYDGGGDDDPDDSLPRRINRVPRRFQWYIAEGMFSLPATKYSMVIRFSVVR